MALGEIDHLVVSSATLSEGVAFLEDLLGVPMAEGGEHPLMGTHNALLSLGPATYLEVIAINPEASQPDHARWFDLDYFTGPTRLTNWAVRVPELPEALQRAPAGMGVATRLERGSLVWDMAISENGRLPFDGCAPGMLSWAGAQPAPNLPDQAIRLAALEVTHPEAEALSVAIAPLVQDDRLSVHVGKPAVAAWLDTPNGLVKLP
ncbi:VOC family protein [Aliiroseovarius sp. 2305UL8-7]|uniref:VOC family protein n=1 Tax=Aliiroseovarius conchicola TaxID=3121637 RepID=UPI00352874C9